MITGRKPIGTLAYLGGVPAVLEKFCWSWGQLISFSQHYVCESNEYIHLAKAEMSFHSWARNSLVEQMLGDWILMLDTDHAPEPDLLGRLLHRMNTYNLDVLVGIYQFKQPPHPPVLYGWFKNDNQEGYTVLGNWNEDVPVQTVAGAGGGCLLVRRRVFERIERELGEKPFDPIGQGGEDLAFFSRLKKLGIKAYFDCRVECPHLLIKPVTLKDFTKVKPHKLTKMDSVVGFKEQ